MTSAESDKRISDAFANMATTARTTWSTDDFLTELALLRALVLAALHRARNPEDDAS